MTITKALLFITSLGCGVALAQQAPSSAGGVLPGLSTGGHHPGTEA